MQILPPRGTVVRTNRVKAQASAWHIDVYSIKTGVSSACLPGTLLPCLLSLYLFLFCPFLPSTHRVHPTSCLTHPVPEQKLSPRISGEDGPSTCHCTLGLSPGSSSQTPVMPVHPKSPKSPDQHSSQNSMSSDCPCPAARQFSLQGRIGQ